jgi:hypothetical protein
MVVLKLPMFHGYDMVNTCESHFSALRAGYPLWEV